MNLLEEKQKAYLLDRFLTQLDCTDLLIVDELGYLSFSRGGAELLARGWRVDEDKTPEASILSYNNFYELTTNKESVAEAAKDFRTDGWQLVVDGMVNMNFISQRQHIDCTSFTAQFISRRSEKPGPKNWGTNLAVVRQSLTYSTVRNKCLGY